MTKLSYIGKIVGALGLLWLLMGLGISKAQTERAAFEITDGEKVLGELIAVRKEVGNNTVVVVKSTTKVSRLVTITVEYEGELVYHNGRMIRCVSSTRVNGYRHSYSELEWRGDHYWMQVDGDPKEVNDRIRFSGSMMYFTEPEYHGTVFSEKFGEFDPIIRMGEGRYVVEKGDGTRHTYTYDNGKLMTVEYPHSFMDVVIRRK